MTAYVLAVEEDVPVAIHGVSIKRWFYELRALMRKRPAHVRAIFAGAACEQWLNGELFALVASGLPPSLYAWPEAEKRDICVFTVGDKHSDRNDDLVATIEVKLVYSWHGPGEVAARLRKLRSQMAANRKAGALSYGLIIGVIKNPWLRDGWHRGHTPEAFARRIGKEIDEQFTKHGIVRGKPAMERLVPVGQVWLGGRGGRARKVGLVGQYVEYLGLGTKFENRR